MKGLWRRSLDLETSERISTSSRQQRVGGVAFGPDDNRRAGQTDLTFSALMRVPLGTFRTCKFREFLFFNFVIRKCLFVVISASSPPPLWIDVCVGRVWTLLCVHVCVCVSLTCQLVHIGVDLKSTTSTAGSGRGLTVRPTSTSEQVVSPKMSHP